MRIALGVEYDGAGFHGFQTQRNGATVQDAVERALSAIAAQPVSIVGAGRTDAGVHALLQVVHFDTAAQRPANAWVRGVNRYLPTGVAVLWEHAVPTAFHARFSAQRRYYTYLLLARAQRPGINTGRVGWYHGPLDPTAMSDGANYLAGTHDFTSFRASSCAARTPVRTVERLTVTAYGDLLRIDIVADAFLHHMVRNIVGALVVVGAQRKPPAWIGELLAARNRAAGPPTFAAAGLYLTGVRYDAAFGLPATLRDFSSRCL